VNDSRLRAEIIPIIEGLLSKLKRRAIRTAIRTELKRQYNDNVAEASRAQVQQTGTIEQLEKRLAALEDALLDGNLTRERYLVRRDETCAKIDAIKKEHVGPPPSAAPDFDRLCALAESITIADLDDTSWRLLIEGMTQQITIRGRDIEVEWKPEYLGLIP